jgi:ribosomal protein L11 methyltransferase
MPMRRRRSPSSSGSKTSLADATRRWPALDITLRAAHVSTRDAARSPASARVPEGDAPETGPPGSEGWVEVEGLLLAFLDDHSPTAITAPPGGEEGWLVTASQQATPAWLPGPGPEPATVAASASPSPPRIGADAPVPRAWRVFFASAEARDGARAALVASAWGVRVDLTTVDVEDEGWAERSQAALRAVQVGRLIIAPPWDVPTAVAHGEADADADAAAPLLVIIEPSMGFGTGHHQSTRLCLHALQAIDLAGRRVLDLGTGSGVLAIAAAMLGADSVLALDDDRDAVDAARGNVRLNGMDARVSVQQADLTAIEPPRADVVLANLTGALLMRHAASIVRHLTPGGLIVLSGFTDDERFAVAHAFRDLRLLRDDREDGWLGLTLQQPEPSRTHH